MRGGCSLSNVVEMNRCQWRSRLSPEALAYRSQRCALAPGVITARISAVTAGAWLTTHGENSRMNALHEFAASLFAACV